MEPLEPLYKRRENGDFFCQNSDEMTAKRKKLSKIIENHRRFQRYQPSNTSERNTIYFDPDRDLFFIPDRGFDGTQTVMDYAFLKNMHAPSHQITKSFAIRLFSQAMNELKMSSGLYPLQIEEGIPIVCSEAKQAQQLVA